MEVQKTREDIRSIWELRIVLLGSRWSGKSSAGNTVLGREEFDLRRTGQCVKGQGEVAGRRVTVVDTPGWRRDIPLEWTAELAKHEMTLSVSLCPPGPHTILLIIDVDFEFIEENRRAVEVQLELLNETVWSHTMVLFTHGDYLGDTTIEQHINSEGKALQWLVEKCGNRYHVFDNKNRGDGTQVTELLEKIEEMVAGNRGCHYKTIPTTCFTATLCQQPATQQLQSEELQEEDNLTKVETSNTNLNNLEPELKNLFDPSPVASLGLLGPLIPHQEDRRGGGPRMSSVD
uniref:AIG1-type G domain-containing protein n=2 Tax=Esox lucius TaxID=8010 RepID=A0A6Q2XI41_ESOLU